MENYPSHPITSHDDYEIFLLLVKSYLLVLLPQLPPVFVSSPHSFPTAELLVPKDLWRRRRFGLHQSRGIGRLGVELLRQRPWRNPGWVGASTAPGGLSVTKASDAPTFFGCKKMCNL